MAANYIKYDTTKTIPRSLDRYGRMLVEALEGLVSVQAAIIQQRDGDGSLASHYDLVATEGGYQAADYADANTAARASFLELDSLLSKINTDNSVSAVKAAIYQFAAKHGIIN